MDLILAFSFLAIHFVAGIPEAQTTARAELRVRQTANSAAFIGYSPQGGFWPLTYPEVNCQDMKVYQTSGDYARCGDAQSSADTQYPTACSDGTLVYSGTQKDTCDSPSSTCDTARIVPFIGATETVSMVSCWSTMYSLASVDFYRNTNGAPVTDSASATGSPKSASDSTSSTTPKSTGAAVLCATHPNTGLAGLLAGLVALL